MRTTKSCRAVVTFSHSAWRLPLARGAEELRMLPSTSATLLHVAAIPVLPGCSAHLEGMQLSLRRHVRELQLRQLPLGCHCPRAHALQILLLSRRKSAVSSCRSFTNPWSRQRDITLAQRGPSAICPCCPKWFLGCGSASASRSVQVHTMAFCCPCASATASATDRAAAACVAARPAARAASARAAASSLSNSFTCSGQLCRLGPALIALGA